MKKYVNLSTKQNMLLYRYMDYKEFIHMIRGYDICASTNPDIYDDGLMFLGERTVFYSKYYNEDGHFFVYTPEECLKIMEDKICDDILVEFIPTELVDLEERYRIYG